MKNLIKKLENVNINQKVKVFNHIFDNDYKIIKENDNYYLMDLILNDKTLINENAINNEYNHILENYNNINIERIIFNY